MPRPCLCDRCNKEPQGAYKHGDCIRCYVWHHNPIQRKEWEGQEPLQQRNIEPAGHTERLRPCRHAGPPTRLELCPTCTGDKTVRLRLCAKHGECIEGFVLPGVKECGACSDRSPLKPEEGFLILPGLYDPIPEPEDPRRASDWAKQLSTRLVHIRSFRWMLQQDLPPPEKATGDGILFVGGGKYWSMIQVAIRMTRSVTDLPIQIWYRGREEFVQQEDIADVPDVQLIDATAFVPPPRILRGWELKAYALLKCGWERVLYFDADAYPVRDPQPLLDKTSKDCPFVFWEDLPGQSQAVQWGAFGLSNASGVPAIQGGQLAIHRAAFWRELVLFHWWNQHSDYCYQFGYGDQDVWRVVLAATHGKFENLGMAPWEHPAFVCRLNGEPIIVHRCQGKLWGKGKDRRAMHLPEEARVWTHLSRVKK